MTWMIVEDDAAIRDVIEMICALRGFKTIIFRDGFQAIEYLINPNPPDPLPDVALLDIRMPGPWGHEISSRIRQHPVLKDIGIILMTAYELPGADEERYLRTSGADRLLFKPFPPIDDLLAMINGVIQTRSTSPHPREAQLNRMTDVLSEKIRQHFAPESLRVFARACKEAERLNHSQVQPEHVLLAVLHEGTGVARQVLRGLGVDQRRAEVLITANVHSWQRAPGSEVEISAGTKLLLELAVNEARRLGDHSIGTEHLLLAISSYHGRVMQDILAELRIKPDQIRKQTIRSLRDARESQIENFEDFNRSARGVLYFAQEEARHLHHSDIGTEHLLIGLLADELGIASRVLRDLGVRLTSARSRIIEKRFKWRTPFTKIYYSPTARRVLEQATEEARRLGHHDVGSEHLLLALVSQKEDVVLDILAEQRVTPKQVREQTLQILQRSSSPPNSQVSNASVRVRQWFKALQGFVIRLLERRKDKTRSRIGIP